METVKFNISSLKQLNEDKQKNSDGHSSCASVDKVPRVDEAMKFKGRKPQANEPSKFFCPYTRAHFDYDQMFSKLLELK